MLQNQTITNVEERKIKTLQNFILLQINKAQLIKHIEVIFIEIMDSLSPFKAEKLENLVKIKQKAKKFLEEPISNSSALPIEKLKKESSNLEEQQLIVTKLINVIDQISDKSISTDISIEDFLAVLTIQVKLVKEYIDQYDFSALLSKSELENMQTKVSQWISAPQISNLYNLIEGLLELTEEQKRTWQDYFDVWCNSVKTLLESNFSLSELKEAKKRWEIEKPTILGLFVENLPLHKIMQLEKEKIENSSDYPEELKQIYLNHFDKYSKAESFNNSDMLLQDSLHLVAQLKELCSQSENPELVKMRAFLENISFSCPFVRKQISPPQ